MSETLKALLAEIDRIEADYVDGGEECRGQDTRLYHLMNEVRAALMGHAPPAPPERTPSYDELAAECDELRKINSLLLRDAEATPAMEEAIGAAREVVEWAQGLDADIQAAKVQGLIDAVLKSPAPPEGAIRAAAEACAIECAELYFDPVSGDDDEHSQAEARDNAVADMSERIAPLIEKYLSARHGPSSEIPVDALAVARRLRNGDFFALSDQDAALLIAAYAESRTQPARIEEREATHHHIVRLRKLLEEVEAERDEWARKAFRGREERDAARKAVPLAHLGAPAKWTTERPTTRGLYWWVRRVGDSASFVARVEADEAISQYPSGEYEFCGPLPPPAG